MNTATLRTGATWVGITILALAVSANCCSGCPDEDTITIVSDNLPAQGVVAVGSGHINGQCRAWASAMVSSSSSTIVGDAISHDPCPSEIAFFSRGDPVSVVTPQWTANADHITADLSNGNHSDPISVPLRGWVHPLLLSAEFPLTDAGCGTTGACYSWANRLEDIATIASQMFDGTNATGIVFSSSVFPSIPGSEADVGPGCTYRDQASLAAKGLYDPGTINIYFVWEIKHKVLDTGMTLILQGDDLPGLTCKTPIPRNVVYLSIRWSLYTTIYHELGHVFGLAHTGDDGIAYYGFSNDNLMVPQGHDRKSLSLGQTYRTAFHDGSWLNMPNAPSTGVPAALVKTCQDIGQGTGVCPAAEASWPSTVSASWPE